MESSLTIKKAIDSPSIKQLRTIHNIKIGDVAKIIHIQILRTIQLLNVTNTMNDLQVEHTVFEILERYPHESIEDFCIALKKGRNGLYGTVYNRLDPSIVFDWINAYLNEKSYEREQINHNKYTTSKKSDLPIDDFYRIGIKQQKKLDEVKNKSANNEAEFRRFQRDYFNKKEDVGSSKE